MQKHSEDPIGFKILGLGRKQIWKLFLTELTENYLGDCIQVSVHTFLTTNIVFTCILISNLNP